MPSRDESPTSSEIRSVWTRDWDEVRGVRDFRRAEMWGQARCGMMDTRELPCGSWWGLKTHSGSERGFDDDMVSVRRGVAASC